MTARFILDGSEDPNWVIPGSGATPCATEPDSRDRANSTPVLRFGAPPDLIANNSQL